MQQKSRSSNIELFRIILMLAIVAHHYVVNSGLTAPMGPLANDPMSAPSLFYRLFGMWGKTGINCFVLITGYFMCQSMISIRKFLKLYLEITFWQMLIWGIFILCGRSAFSWFGVLTHILPFTKLSYNFSQCYMAFFCCIPFLNVLVRNLDKKSHGVLILLLLCMYSLLHQIPGFKINFNYVSWFCVIYIVASYIRYYGLYRDDSLLFWSCVLAVVVLGTMLSVVMCIYLKLPAYSLVGECPKFGAVAVAISAFMVFRNLPIPNSPVINTIASLTFGIFLIHTAGESMRRWLWGDVVNVVGHYNTPYYVLYALFSVAGVFCVCGLLDMLRMYCLEKPIFRWLDRRLGSYSYYSDGWQP